MKIRLPQGSHALRYSVVLCLFTLAAGIASTAQCLAPVHVLPAISAPPAADRHKDTMYIGNRTIRADVDLVLVPTLVTDSLNHPVTNLEKHNFAVFDGDQAQEIKYFNSEDMPISIGILLDTSGSMRNEKFVLAKKAITEFFSNANRDDDYFVITFSEKPQLLADTTQSIDRIEAELESVVPSGGTPLLDAIYLGLDKLKHARYQRRALLIISDGGDNTSRYRSKEIRSIAQESDAQIYALGIFSPVPIAIEDWRGKKLLSEITDATGGRSVFLSSPDRLPEISADFSRELRSQYVLGYRPQDLQRDGRLHKITVKLNAGFVHPAQLYYKRQYVASR